MIQRKQAAKTAVFLSERYVDIFDFDKVPEIERYRLVAIVRESCRGNFPADKEHLFGAICTVPDKKGGRTALPELEYGPTREIIERELAHIGSPDRLGLICADEGNVTLAGRLRDELGIKGLGEQQAILFRNKVLMKDALRERGIRVPRHRTFDKGALAEDTERYHALLVRELGAPFIIKPVQEASSFGIFKITDFDAFRACREAIADAAAGAYEAEEFLEGKLFHIDALVQDGRTVFAECSELTWPALEYLDGKALGSLPLPDHDPRRKRILDFADEVLVGLGKPDGASHMEAFLTPGDELVFLEIASRVPGALIVPTYERTYGLNMFTADFLIQMQEPISFERKVLTHCCWAIFPAASGIVEEVLEPDLRSEHAIRWFVKPGDNLAHGSASMLEKVGTLLAWNDDYSVLREDFDKLRSHIFLSMRAHES